jgi:hypothetical protein
MEYPSPASCSMRYLVEYLSELVVFLSQLVFKEGFPVCMDVYQRISTKHSYKVVYIQHNHFLYVIETFYETPDIKLLLINKKPRKINTYLRPRLQIGS